MSKRKPGNLFPIGKMEREEEADGDNNQPSPSQDSSPCPICLGPFLDESYLDTCFHKFCYKCIIQWTKVVAGKHSRKLSSVKCPLCKTENSSIIYGYDGSSFQRHCVNQHIEDCSFFSKAHKYRLQCYYAEEGVLNDVVNISRYWKLRKYLQPNRWLQIWTRREIQALLQEEDVDIIVHHLLGVIDSFLRRNDQANIKKTLEATRDEFRALVSNAAIPFLAARSDRFVNELELFLASGLNIEAYDEVYMQRLGRNTPRVVSEAAEGESSEHATVVPYLYIFDDESDENE